MPKPLRFLYQTIEYGDEDIHIRSLRDNQQFFDESNTAKSLGIYSSTWSLFGLLWPSGRALANYMLTYNIDGLKILEVGCGLGLSSLLLNRRNANITATDYHPEAHSFLNFNTNLNNDRPISFIRADWQHENHELGQFDLIIGSDLLYEPNQAALLSNFIEQHARQQCTVILSDPGRGNVSRFGKSMAMAGYSIHSDSVNYNDNNTQYSGKIYIYSRRTSLRQT